MLKPSKRHFLRYDAQTYEEKGFIDLAGKVQEMAQKPRFWQITAKAITQDKDGIEQQSKHFKFNTSELKALADARCEPESKVAADLITRALMGEPYALRVAAARMIKLGILGSGVE